jgi:hypothetical protein
VPGRNIEVTLDNISDKLVKNIPGYLVDLIEIASYVYCGDQSFSRGGDRGRDDGADWERALRFIVPVRCVERWSTPAVTDALREALGFLSGEEVNVEFQALHDPVPVTGYLAFGKDRGLGTTVEEVLLFSGGLDSLAGVVREAVVAERAVALVSHRSTPKVVQCRESLIKSVADLCPGRRPYHIPVWVHKKGLQAKENTQRTRTFLYASLGMAVARLYNLERIRFYENGITSLQLPISAQLIGSRASRSTHPKTLRLFSHLFSLLAERTFTVQNPGFWFTKTDLVGKIGKAGAANLIGQTRSCHHTQDASEKHTHCGRCSQCLGRRFATLASGHARQDAVGKYRSDPLLSSTKEGPERVLAESIPRVARETQSGSDADFFQRYGELGQALDGLDGDVDHNAERILKLHRRHSRQVLKVLEEAIRDQARSISRQEIPSTSVLGMALGAKDTEAAAIQKPPADEFKYFRPNSDYTSLSFRGKQLPVRPRAAQILQVMHEEFVLTQNPSVSVPILKQATNLKGELLGHLRHCKSIWKTIVGPAGKNRVKFLVLPSPDSSKLVFRSEK